MIGISFRMMRVVKQFCKAHPVIAFGAVMLSMYGLESSKKNKLYSGD